MASTQVVETSVANNSASQDSITQMIFFSHVMLLRVQTIFFEENNITIRELSTDADSTPAPDELIN